MLRVVVDPACGGKIRSFLSRQTGREYFYQDPRASFTGDGYSDHDVTGLDECFPTVMACAYPAGRWQGLELGDHGWLWNRPWEVEVHEDSIVAAIETSPPGIRFERTCRLARPGGLQLDYVIENLGDEPFEFLYANHLLLASDGSTRIVYPADMRRAFVTVAQDLHDGLEQTWIAWPPPPDLGVSEPFDPRRGNLIKLFSPRLTQGRAAVSHGELSESLCIEFDVVGLPYLGVLIAQGYGPNGRDGQGQLLGLEATTGIGDDLPGCRATKTSSELQPGELRRFYVKLSLE